MTTTIRTTSALIGIIAVAGFHWDAHAYLNPGTGSMILQALIAGLAVVAVTIKLYWFKLIAFLKGEKYEPEEDLLADLESDTDDSTD